MNNYETMFVFSVAKGEEGVSALTEKFKALIGENGTLTSAEPFGSNGGVRTLAYEIEDETQGAYILMNYEGAASLPAAAPGWRSSAPVRRTRRECARSPPCAP